jgi:hypothetical protein
MQPMHPVKQPPDDRCGAADIEHDVPRQRGMAQQGPRPRRVIFDQRRAQAAIRLLGEIVEAGGLLVTQQHLVEIIADDVDHQPLRAETLPRINRVIEVVEQRTAGRGKAVDPPIPVLPGGKPAVQRLRKRHHGSLDIAVADHRQQRPRICGVVVPVVGEAIIVDMTAVDVGQERAVRIEIIPVCAEADDRICGIDRLNLETAMDRQ